MDVNLSIVRGTHQDLDAPIPLIAVCTAGGNRILGAYELSNYSDGALLKRICDP